MPVRLGALGRLDRGPLLGWYPGSPLDLLQDVLQFDVSAGAVPALLVGAEHEAVAAPVGVEPCAVGDGLSVGPGAFCDLSSGWPGHQCPRRWWCVRLGCIGLTSRCRAGGRSRGAPAFSRCTHLTGAWRRLSEAACGSASP